MKKYDIGCGACELHVQQKPYKAIYIDSNEVHQVAKKPTEEKLEENIDYNEAFPF